MAGAASATSRALTVVPEAASPDADSASIQRNVEALLFVADEPLSVVRLAEVLTIDAPAIELALARIECEYRGRGFVLRAIAGGYRFATAPSCAPTVTAYRGRGPLQLSDAAIEVLAIIAHNQPATRAEVDQLRGVDSAGVVATLLHHGLLEERGHRVTPGHPALLGTTKLFLETFGLWDLRDLPAVDAEATAPDEPTAAPGAASTAAA